MNFIELFNHIDNDHCGEITIDDLEVFMKNNKFSHKFVDNWLEIFDSKHKGRITLDEFCDRLGLEIDESFTSLRNRRRLSELGFDEFVNIEPDMEQTIVTMSVDKPLSSSRKLSTRPKTLNRIPEDKNKEHAAEFFVFDSDTDNKTSTVGSIKSNSSSLKSPTVFFNSIFNKKGTERKEKSESDTLDNFLSLFHKDKSNTNKSSTTNDGNDKNEIKPTKQKDKNKVSNTEDKEKNKNVFKKIFENNLSPRYINSNSKTFKLKPETSRDMKKELKPDESKTGKINVKLKSSNEKEKGVKDSKITKSEIKPEKFKSQNTEPEKHTGKIIAKEPDNFQKISKEKEIKDASNSRNLYNQNLIANDSKKKSKNLDKFNKTVKEFDEETSDVDEAVVKKIIPINININKLINDKKNNNITNDIHIKDNTDVVKGKVKSYNINSDKTQNLVKGKNDFENRLNHPMILKEEPKLTIKNVDKNYSQPNYLTNHYPTKRDWDRTHLTKDKNNLQNQNLNKESNINNTSPTYKLTSNEVKNKDKHHEINASKVKRNEMDKQNLVNSKLDYFMNQKNDTYNLLDSSQSIKIIQCSMNQKTSETLLNGICGILQGNLDNFDVSIAKKIKIYLDTYYGRVWHVIVVDGDVNAFGSSEKNMRISFLIDDLTFTLWKT